MGVISGCGLPYGGVYVPPLNGSSFGIGGPCIHNNFNPIVPPIAPVGIPFAGIPPFGVTPFGFSGVPAVPFLC